MILIRSLIIAFILFSPNFLFGETTLYFSVVIEKTPSKSKAIAVAKEASSKLQLSLAEETLKSPPSKLLLKGLVVSLHRDKDNNYVVTSFLGNTRSGPRLALASVQKYFKSAKIEETQVDENQLDSSYMHTMYKRVLILGSEKSYPSALAKAKEISQKTGVPFSTREMIFDEKRGLIWPDNFSDEIYAGTYFGRRDNSGQKGDYISIEKSDFYGGFTKGYYIIVGGIYAEGDEKLSIKLSEFKKVVPDAYAKHTPIYMGCVH